MIDGRTVLEVPDEPGGAKEIAQLWQYIENRLAGTRRTILASDPLRPAAQTQNLL